MTTTWPKKFHRRSKEVVWFHLKHVGMDQLNLKESKSGHLVGVLLVVGNTRIQRENLVNDFSFMWQRILAASKQSKHVECHYGTAVRAL